MGDANSKGAGGAAPAPAPESGGGAKAGQSAKASRSAARAAERARRRSARAAAERAAATLHFEHFLATLAALHAEAQATPPEQHTAAQCRLLADRLEFLPKMANAIANELEWVKSREYEAETKALAAGMTEEEANRVVDEEHGTTILMQASRKGDEAQVRRLLAAGARVDAADTRFGMTALMHAVYSGSKPTVRTLVEKGADTSLKTKDGWTAHRCAIGPPYNGTGSEILEG